MPKVNKGRAVTVRRNAKAGKAKPAKGRPAATPSKPKATKPRASRAKLARSKPAKTARSKRAERKPTKAQIAKARADRLAEARAARAAAAAAAVRFEVKPLDPRRKCGAGTSVQFLYRVDERTVERGSTTHLVFFDRHGWYCEHGRTCPAVGHARKYNGQIARAS